MLKSMNKVLFLSYYFPPMGMGGVQRVSKFCRYLPEFQWKPAVVTVRDTVYYAHDNSLIDDLKNTEIYRTGSLDPLRISFLMRSLSGKKKNGNKQDAGKKSALFETIFKWLFIPDTKILWVPFAAVNAYTLIRSQKIPVIVSTSPPLSSHIAGYLLKKMTNVSWIADFRDHWIIDKRKKYPTPFHRIIDRLTKKLILNNADAITGVSSGIIDEMKKSVNREEECYSVLCNGYDTEDFPAEYPVRDDNTFRIVYSGTFNEIHSPLCFLDGLKLAAEENNSLNERTRFLHCGISAGYNLVNETEKRRINNMLVEKGYQPHRESIRYLLSADILLLVQSEHCPPGMIPGKLFEYLASGIPILAIIPEGDAADIIRKYQSGVICPPDAPIIKSEIVRCYKEWEKKGSSKEDKFIINSEYKMYSRKAQTAQLVKIIEKTISSIN